MRCDAIRYYTLVYNVASGLKVSNVLQNNFVGIGDGEIEGGD